MKYIEFEDYIVPNYMGFGGLRYSQSTFFSNDYYENKSQGCGNIIFYVKRENLVNNGIYEYRE